jgi:hypothetical protein
VCMLLVALLGDSMICFRPAATAAQPAAQP